MKERYPRFVDALEDFDDCLTLTYLYATLPAGGDNGRVHPTPHAKLITKAKQLVANWGAYCATTSCITKQFISIKGIYMEAVVHNTTIRWIIPHAYTQFIPDDVDFRIMNTFFELYQVMFDFILFKLYNYIGVRYPLASTAPGAGNLIKDGTTSAILGSHLVSLRNALDATKSGGIISSVVTQSQKEQQKDATGSKKENDKSKDETASTKANRIESVADALKHLSDSEDDNDANEKDDDDDDDEDKGVDVAGPLKAALERIHEEEHQLTNPATAINNAENDTATLQRKRLFQGLTFFISREVPKGFIELICLAYGAKAVGWEGSDISPISIKDPSITHHIVDRPKLPTEYSTLPKSREYIQPQWVFDCANFLYLIPLQKYTVGAELPPHLSPWVNDEEEGYKPAYAEEIDRLKNGLEPIEEDNNNDNEVIETSTKNKRKATTIPDEKAKAVDKKKKTEEDNNKVVEDKEEENEDDDESEDDNANNDDDDDDEEEEEEEEEDENDKAVQEKLERKRKSEEEEEHKLARSMMSRKATHLYNRMQHGLSKKKAKFEKLHERRKELDEQKKKESATNNTRTPTAPKVSIIRHSNVDDSDDDVPGSSKASNRAIIKGKVKGDDGKSVLKQKVERLKKERKTIEKAYDNTGGTMKKKK